ncbi:MAG: PQQ-binding-like beta-propeller repeat protein [Candidatus Micrarchaeia archaeon]|jgi:outer membrane protein assembly factor BamB
MRKLAAFFALLLLCQLGTADIEKWRFATGAYVYSSPQAMGTSAVFGSHDGAFYGVNAETGRLERSLRTNGPVDSDATVAGNVAYIGSTDGYLYAVEPGAGTFNIKWQAKTGGIWQSKPLAVGGLVYVGSVDGRVYAFDSATGRQAWNFTSGSEVDSAPAYKDGVVYVASSDGNLYALNALNGSLQRTVRIGGLWLSSPTIDGSMLFVGSTDGAMYAFDIARSGLVWKYQTGGTVLATPTVIGNAVVFGSGDNNVYSVRKDDGKLLWKFAANGSVQAQVATAPDDAGGFTVYAGSLDGNVYALNAQNGSQLWSADTGDWVGAKPLPAGSMLIVPSYDNGVRGLSTLSCSFTSPAESEAVGGPVLEVQGTAWSDAGVNYVDVRANGGAWVRASGTTVWSMALPAASLADGDVMLECRPTAPLPVGEEKAPYNNVTVSFSRDFAGKLISADYPRTEVPYGSEVRIKLTGPQDEPVFGAVAKWDGGSTVSGKDGVVLVKADKQGAMDITVQAQGYEDKKIVLSVGLNYTVYVGGAVVVLVLAYYILVYRRKK